MSDTSVTPASETPVLPGADSAPPALPTMPAAAPTPVPDDVFDDDGPGDVAPPLAPPAPLGGASPAGPSSPTGPTEGVDAVPSLPVVSPVLSAPAAPPSAPPEPSVHTDGEPTIEPSVSATVNPVGEQHATAPALPSLPQAPASEPVEDDADAETEPTDEQQDHPMAHLMPPKSKPTEASRRAAEIRAGQKAKAKKVKIGMVIGALVVSAVAGPPLFSWLQNAINEAGGTSTEEPAD